LPKYREELLKVQERTLKDGTVKRYRYAAKTVNGYLDAASDRINYAIEHSPNITVAQKAALLETFRKGKKRIKINSIAVPESKILSYEEIRELIAGIAVFQPKRKDGSLVVLSDAGKHELQVTALLAEFMAYNATRISETLNILLSDMKPTNGQYATRILGKGSKERTIFSAKELVDRIKTTCNGSTYLFETANGEQYKRITITARIRRYSQAILGRSVSAHCLRHSWATYVHKKTGRTKAVQNQLGHASASTTIGQYVHDNFSANEIDDLFK
jgi:integrase